MNNDNIKTPYFLPPEWAPQSGVMLTWPHQNTIWADTLADIDNVFVNVAKQVTQHERLIIACTDKSRIQALLKKANIDFSKIAIYEAPSDDIWVRDHGPISVLCNNQPILLDFIFNGWGNKYPAENDNNLTLSLHAQGTFGTTPHHAINMVLEGGGIEVDGKGTLLTTKSCLLAKNRNPDLSQEEIEKNLYEWFGIKRILWLEHGALEGDDTDGHIDTLARFIDVHTICYVSCDDPADSHYESLKKMEEELKTFTDYQGNPYQLHPLPWPKARFAAVDGRRLPATYANFLIINDAVLVPTYNDPADEKALALFRELFPARQIIGIPSLPVIEWYGSLHCMTMQLPQGVLT